MNIAKLDIVLCVTCFHRERSPTVVVDGRERPYDSWQV